MADKKKKKIIGKAKATKPKATAKKPTAKPAVAKSKAPKKATKPAKKTTLKRASISPKAKKAPKKADKPLKHSDKDEMNVKNDKGKININITPKRQPKAQSAAQPKKSVVTENGGRVSSITYHIRYD